MQELSIFLSFSIFIWNICQDIILTDDWIKFQLLYVIADLLVIVKFQTKCYLEVSHMQSYKSLALHLSAVFVNNQISWEAVDFSLHWLILCLVVQK